MEHIKSQISEVYQFPSLSSNLIMNPIPDMSYAESVIKSRKTVELTNDEFNSLIESDNIFFYDADKESLSKNRLARIDTDDFQGDLSTINDGFSLSEYVGRYEKYIVNPYYIKYAKENNKNIFVTVYGAEDLFDLSHRVPVIRDKVDLHNEATSDKRIVFDQFKFDIPKSLRYTTFDSKGYDSGLLIPALQDSINILSMNIPYKYYLNQPLHPSVYNWDVDKNEHRFGPLNPTEFSELFSDILKNGITEPLFMRMDGEILTAPDIKSNLILFIAKLLKLPSVPVNVILSNDSAFSNRLIDAIIAEDKNLRDIICNSTESMTEIFDPYIILYKNENKMSSYIKANNKEYSRIMYKIFNDNGHIKVRYLDKSVDPSILDEIEADINKQHEELRKLENEKIDKDIQSIIDKLTPPGE